MHDLPEFPPPIAYRPDILTELERLGVKPRPDTQPRIVYSFLRALYTFEIRDRKARRRELERFFGPQPLADYEREIETLREHYRLLRVHLRDWIERAPAGTIP